MKLIKAIVRPNKVDEVKAALEKIQVSGMTVTEVRGHGKQKGHTGVYRGKEYSVSLLPKMQIEIVITDEVVDEVIQAVIQAADRGESGIDLILLGQLAMLERRAPAIEMLFAELLDYLALFSGLR